MRTLLIVAVLAPLAACSTSKPIEQMSYTEMKSLAGEIIKRCNEQGVANGTPEMNLCTGQELEREKSLRRARESRKGRTVVCNQVFNTVMCS